MEPILNWLMPILLGLVSKWPVLTSVFMVMGVLRSVMKPFFSFLHSLVDATPSAADNQILINVENSKVFSVVSYILDWFASVKLSK